MLRLKDASTRQLETLYEQADGNLQLLQALSAELAQRPSVQAQALLAEIQVESFRLEQGFTDDVIDWDEVVSTHQLHEEQREACRHVLTEGTQLASSVLDTWMITETLTPQTFHDPEELASRGTLLPLDNTMPWFVPSEPMDGNKSRYYQVYIGDIDIRDVHETLIELYGDNPETLGSLGSAVIAVATFNERGILVGDYGVGVSCFPWSYGRARHNKIHHLPFWQGAERLLIRRLRKKLSPVSEEQVPRPVTYDDVQNALNWLVDNLDLPPEEVQPVRFAVRIVQSSKRRPPSSPLLNSFLLNDLWRAKDALLKNKVGTVLQRYLSDEIACVKAKNELPEALKQALDISRLPLCRWPSYHGHGLDALQQAAVNIAIHEDSPALFSVHGPPGTGKTTLLRDIIAAIILKRAQVLCEFDDPEDAFGQPQIVKYGDQRYDIYPLDERLLGHEILVCSRNNKAVENISLELPMKREVNRFCGDVNYFADTMQAYLEYKKETATLREDIKNAGPLPLFPSFHIEQSHEYEPWGMIAAALGNGTNRRAYIQGVWLDEVHGFKQYFEKMYSAWEQAEVVGDIGETDVDDYFFLPASKEEAMQTWRDAQSLFLVQQATVKAALPERQLNYDIDYQLPDLPILQSERDALFVAAMKLHQAFVLAAAPKFKENLSGYFRVIAGARGSKPELLPHLWATGGFITPVISTTFASVHRMLHDMPNESIGWVLIDEAGQASPQDAVGALLRAKRAIVVGDPQQIEPVVSIPDGLIQGIAAHHSIEALQWTAPDMSVQSLADRVNPFGFKLQERTIGWPILVHRRCAEPMFTMINHMAYKGLMVRQEDNRKGHAQWIHVVGESRQKWCPEEGQKCLQLIVQLLEKSDDSIYIISPFRHCAQSLRSLFRKEKKTLLKLGIADPSHWIRQSIGTVHTFQGRQAAKVVFVLGAQGIDEKGARLWATRKVNLCNVAVSRAQRALYIIGHRDLWGHLGAMKFISRHMPEDRKKALENG